MPKTSIAELLRRVERLLRMIRLINQKYASRTAAEIDECEREIQSLLQEIQA